LTNRLHLTDWKGIGLLTLAMADRVRPSRPVLSLGHRPESGGNAPVIAPAWG
jgi:hypothetical protein